MAMSAEHFRSKFAAPFTGNGDVSINVWVKKIVVGQKTHTQNKSIEI